MINFITFGIIVMILILVGGLIFAIRLYLREKKEPEDSTHFLNFMPQYADGHNKGVINRVVERGNRRGVEFFPRDLNYIKILKESKNIEIKSKIVFFLKDRLLPYSKNSWSDHRSDLIGLPPTPLDMPEQMKKDAFGMAIMKMIEEKNIEVEELTLKNLRIENQHKILRKTEGLEIVEDYMNLNEEKDKMLIKSIGKEEKKFESPRT